MKSNTSITQYYKKNFRKACIMNTYIKIIFPKTQNPCTWNFNSYLKGLIIITKKNTTNISGMQYVKLNLDTMTLVE